MVFGNSIRLLESASGIQFQPFNLHLVSIPRLFAAESYKQNAHLPVDPPASRKLSHRQALVSESDWRIDIPTDLYFFPNAFEPLLFI